MSEQEAIKHAKRFATGAIVFSGMFSVAWAGMHGYEREIIIGVTALILLAFAYVIGWAIEDFREMRI